MSSERQTVVLSRDEKRAVAFLAFVRGTSRSDILRELPPVQALEEYRRVRNGLALTDRQVDNRLRGMNEKTPDA